MPRRRETDMPFDVSFAEMDRQAADRQAKRVELVEKFSKVLAKNFSLNELKFIWNFPADAIRIEAYEIARTKAR
jgi:hypothetical protein